jgi:very-short-patch-repair endonuclease/uncharacterized protein related to proFAR isomerase
LSYRNQEDRFASLKSAEPVRDGDDFKTGVNELEKLEEKLEATQLKLDEHISSIHPPSLIMKKIGTLQFENLTLKMIADDGSKLMRLALQLNNLEHDINYISETVEPRIFKPGELNIKTIGQPNSKKSLELRDITARYKDTAKKIDVAEKKLEYYSNKIDEITSGAISPKLIELSIVLQEAPFTEFDLKKEYSRLFDNRSFFRRLLRKLAPGRFTKKAGQIFRNYLQKCETSMRSSFENTTDFSDTASIQKNMDLLIKLRSLSGYVKEEKEYKAKLTSNELQMRKMFETLTQLLGEYRSDTKADFTAIRGRYFEEISHATSQDYVDNIHYLKGQYEQYLIEKSIETLRTEINDIRARLNSIIQKYHEILSPENQMVIAPYVAGDYGQQAEFLRFMAVEKQAYEIYSSIQETKATLMSKPSLYELEETKINFKNQKVDLSKIILELYWGGIINSCNKESIRKYFDLFEKVLGGGGVKSKQDWAILFSSYRDTFGQMTRILPIWCVTNLSIKRSVPLEPGIFDLVVIDEASQCDIPSAIPLLYRAKQAVIIGDPKQLKHISTLKKNIDKEIAVKCGCESYYSDYFAYSNNSIYDLFSGRIHHENVPPILLNEHYRSHPDIIGFSNEYYYDNKLNISTDQAKLTQETVALPHGVLWIDVQGKLSSKRNTDEAKEVVKRLVEYSQSNLRACSFGVVTLFRNQANFITSQIFSNPNLKGMDITVGTAHKFQGDEKDIILFSPGISTGAEENTLGWIESTTQLINVAVTRARSTLVIVGDKKKCHGAGGVLRSLVEYSDSILQKRSITFDSPIERELYQKLIESGIKVNPQHKVKIGGVEKYRLDFALFVGEKKFDIEIDGAKAHAHKTESDSLRDTHMRMEGWIVRRFTAREVQEDIEKVVDEVKRMC